MHAALRHPAPRRALAALALVVLVLLFPASSRAAAGDDAGLPWFELLLGLCGGLALFLHGMDQMGVALRGVAGSRLERVLGALSNHRVIGLLTGAGVTAVIQSSSVTTVMLVGFVSAGLMTLQQSIGVILGADIGTTITAQIVAFKVTKYSLLLVAAGGLALVHARAERVRHYAFIAMGLGLILFGMSVMSDAMRPLRSYQPFMELMARMDEPALAILAATVFTGLIQSSSAAMGVVIVLAMQGLISLEAGIALALGANVGTCATAGLAAIGKPREAVRVALAHVLFKLIGVALLLPFIEPFADLVRELSPAVDPGLDARELLAAVVPRQVANAHTLFNVAIALIFLPFTGFFAWLITRMLPDRDLSGVPDPSAPRHLDRLLLARPSLALDAARHELGRVGATVQNMYARALPAVLDGTEAELEAVRAEDDVVDALYRHVMAYLRSVGRRRLDSAEARELSSLMSIANHLESIGDVIETELVGIGQRRREQLVVVSEATREVLQRLHGSVGDALTAAVASVAAADDRRAAQAVTVKGEIDTLVERAEDHQVRRLTADEPARLRTYAVEMDVIDKLRRVYYHSKRIAKAVTDAPL